MLHVLSRFLQRQKFTTRKWSDKLNEQCEAIVFKGEFEEERSKMEFNAILLKEGQEIRKVSFILEDEQEKGKGNLIIEEGREKLEANIILKSFAKDSINIVSKYLGSIIKAKKEQLHQKMAKEDMPQHEE